jgi:hypothetical protein
MSWMLRRATLFSLLLVATCKPGEGEPCPAGACASELACHDGQCRNPATFCRSGAQAESCTRDGRCTLSEGACLALTQADCDGARRCKEHGHCKLAGGCCSKDGLCRSPEEDPIVHIDRLRDDASRAAALDKLATLYASALARDGGDASGDHVRALVADIAAPLAAACDAKTPATDRAHALTLAARTRDPATAAALVEAVKSYRRDPARPSPIDAAMPEVLAALAVLRPPEARAPLIALFESQAVQSDDKLAFALSNAVVALADPSYQSKLVARLERPVDPHGDAAAWQSELHWQRTSARALGRIGSEEAIAPLLRVVLSPFKEDIAPAAIEALVWIGKPAAVAIGKVLDGEARALIAQADADHAAAVERELGVSSDNAEAHRIAAAAIALARIGREDAVAAVLDAMDRSDEVGKARIARELVHLPHGPKVVDAFKKIYVTSALDVPITKTHAGIDALAEVAPAFFDASLVPWLVDSALGWQGTDTDLAPFRDAALHAAIALMRSADEPKVLELGQTVTADKHEADRKAALELLAACKDLACWLARAAQDDERAVKAAVMSGVMARAEDAPALARAVAAARSVAARRWLAAALAHALPRGDAGLADDLQKSLELRGSFDDPAVVEAVARLRARAR